MKAGPSLRSFLGLAVVILLTTTMYDDVRPLIRDDGVGSPEATAQEVQADELGGAEQGDGVGSPEAAAQEAYAHELAGVEQVVSWDGTRHLVNTTAYPFIKNGQVGMMAYGDAIQLSGSTDPTVKIYSCTPSFQTNSTWTTFWISGLTNQGSDSTGFFRRNFSDPRVYDIHMLKDFKGFRLFWSNDPCGSASWFFADYPNLAPDATLDYPQLAYDDARDIMVATWTKRVNGRQRLFASNISHGSISTVPRISPVMSSCSAIAHHDVNLIQAQFDFAGDLHLVYTDFTDHTIRHEIWRPRQNKFLCGNEIVGPWSWPAGTCSTCAFKTYEGLESNCLRHFPGATIDVDRATSAIVIAYSTPGSGSCANKAEMRIYRSLDFGRTFQWMLVTGCQNTLKPRVVAEYNPQYGNSATGKFHILSSYAGSSPQLSQVQWTSVDNGATWSGAFITGPRSTPGPVNPASCAWGDYNDGASASGKIFFDWEQKDQVDPTTNVWRVHGITIDVP